MNRPPDALPAPSSSPTLAEVPDLTIHYEQGRVVMATFRNLTIVVWGAQGTLPHVREIGTMSAQLLQTHSKISSVQIILDNTPMPTEEAREGLLRLTELGAPHLVCVASVLSGGGFWASAMRSLLTNVHYVKQRAFVPRIFASLGEAASELPAIHNPRSGVTIHPGELATVFDRLRAIAVAR